jgi:hypothetical protein
MFTEDLIIRAATTVAGSSLVGTASLAQESGIELSIVLWLVGGLLSIIALLLAAISYFIRDMRNQNAVQHKALTESHSNILIRLIKLETEHGIAFQARGCAYEPNRLKDIIRTTMEELNAENTAVRKRGEESYLDENFRED